MINLKHQAKSAKIYIITTSVILFALTLTCIFWLWALILTARPEVVISQWEQQSKHIDSRLATQMLSRLKHSVTINPLDANSHLLIAKYHDYLIQTYQRKDTELAEHAYKRAIELQPSWDYAWALLARFYSRQQDIDEVKLLHALSKAMLLGPFEMKNQEIIIPLLFKHWSLVAKHKQEQNKAIKIFKHALRYSIHTFLTFNSAKKYNQLSTLAPILKRQWHKNLLLKYQKEASNDN